MVLVARTEVMESANIAIAIKFLSKTNTITISKFAEVTAWNEMLTSYGKIGRGGVTIRPHQFEPLFPIKPSLCILIVSHHHPQQFWVAASKLIIHLKVKCTGIFVILTITCSDGCLKSMDSWMEYELGWNALT